MVKRNLICNLFFIVYVGMSKFTSLLIIAIQLMNFGLMLRNINSKVIVIQVASGVDRQFFFC